MNNDEFLRQSQEAVKKMQEYSLRSKASSKPNMPPIPSFVKVPNNNNATPRFSEPEIKKEPTASTKTNSSPFNIPLIDNLLKDSDSTLILGLLLILMSENSDKLLLFALIYILI